MFKCLIESDLESSLFSTYSFGHNIIRPIVVSYFPVSVLASSLFLSFQYSAWVVFNADGSFEIYIKNK